MWLSFELTLRIFILLLILLISHLIIVVSIRLLNLRVTTTFIVSLYTTFVDFFVTMSALNSVCVSLRIHLVNFFHYKI